VSAVMGMAKRCKLKWSETVEIKATRKRVLSAYNNLLLKDYDPATGEIPGWLPGEYHARWAEVVEMGCRPYFGFNCGGFYVRGWKEKDEAQAAGEPPAGEGTGAKKLRPHSCCARSFPSTPQRFPLENGFMAGITNAAPWAAPLPLAASEKQRCAWSKASRWQPAATSLASNSRSGCGCGFTTARTTWTSSTAASPPSASISTFPWKNSAAGGS
jgi:hypothetical protein